MPRFWMRFISIFLAGTLCLQDVSAIDFRSLPSSSAQQLAAGTVLACQALQAPTLFERLERVGSSVLRRSMLLLLAGSLVIAPAWLSAQPKGESVEIVVTDALTVTVPRLTPRGIKTGTVVDATPIQIEYLKTALHLSLAYANQSQIPQSEKDFLNNEQKALFFLIEEPNTVLQNIGVNVLLDADAGTFFRTFDPRDQSIQSVSMVVAPRALESKAKAIAAIGHEVLGHAVRLAPVGSGPDSADEMVAFGRSVDFLEWVVRQSPSSLSQADMVELRGPVLANEKKWLQTHTRLEQEKKDSQQQSRYLAYLAGLVLLGGFVLALRSFLQWRSRRGEQAWLIVAAAYDGAAGKAGAFDRQPAEIRQLLLSSFAKAGAVLPLPDIGLSPDGRNAYPKELKKQMARSQKKARRPLKNQA